MTCMGTSTVGVLPESLLKTEKALRAPDEGDDGEVGGERVSGAATMSDGGGRMEGMDERGEENWRLLTGSRLWGSGGELVTRLASTAELKYRRCVLVVYKQWETRR